MYTVILAAGRGTRMGDLSKETSKVMIEINGKPKLAYTIEQLPEEITDVVVVVNYQAEKIKNYFGESFDGKNIHYAHQESLDGTDGAVRAAQKHLHEQDKFLVLSGDDLFLKKDLQRMLRYSYAMLVHYSHDAKQFGLVSIDDNDFVDDLMEKSERHSEGLIFTGACMLGKEYFDTKPVQVSETEYGLPHTLLSMYDTHPAKAVHTELWLPVGTPEQLNTAIQHIEQFS